MRASRGNFRSLELSPAIHGQQVELHFAATFYQSHVWLNGKLSGTEVTLNDALLQTFCQNRG
jgi:hypothetical protein